MTDTKNDQGKINDVTRAARKEKYARAERMGTVAGLAIAAGVVGANAVGFGAYFVSRWLAPHISSSELPWVLFIAFEAAVIRVAWGLVRFGARKIEENTRALGAGSTLPPSDTAAETPYAFGYMAGLGQGSRDFKDVVEDRKTLGLVLGAFGIFMIAGIGVWSMYALDKLELRMPTAQTFYLVKLGVHALITVALVFFCYQLLRAAERLMLPYWWASQSTEVAKLYLGISDPLSTLKKVAEEMPKLAAAVPGVSVRSLEKIESRSTGE